MEDSSESYNNIDFCFALLTVLLVLYLVNSEISVLGLLLSLLLLSHKVCHSNKCLYFPS